MVREYLPTFRWTDLSEESLLAIGAPGDAPVSYDLRIFDGGLREIHSANDISGTHYELPEALEPNKFYYWSVRARLSDAGEVSVTDTGQSAGHPTCPTLMWMTNRWRDIFPFEPPASRPQAVLSVPALMVRWLSGENSRGFLAPIE